MDDPDWASGPEPARSGARRLRSLASRVETWALVHELVQGLAEEQAFSFPVGGGAYRPRKEMPRAALVDSP